MGTEAGTVEPAGGAVGAGKRILLLVSASHAAQHMSAAMLPLTYSYVLIAFHISYAELGGAVAATGVVGGLSQISAGYVSRRVSARWVLGGQQLVLGLCSVLGSLSPSYAFFAFAQGLGRVGSSQQHPVGGAVMARTYPDRRGQALSLHTIGGSVGSLVVPLPAVVLLSHFGWRPTLLVLSAPLFLMGAILLLTFPVLPSERNRTRVPLTP
ncbi:MAG: MFS transporter, partial [Candidatus Dormibacteria bacterium]